MWTLDPFPETDLLPCRHVNTEEQEEELAEQYELICELYLMEESIREEYGNKIARRLSQGYKFTLDLETECDRVIEQVRRDWRFHKL